ncbi:MAG: hypothetical protein QOI95_820 [Acidimicrobiaceae bacterium]|jgi:hypothetical protein
MDDEELRLGRRQPAPDGMAAVKWVDAHDRDRMGARERLFEAFMAGIEHGRRNV